jgi:hypothetical protein
MIKARIIAISVLATAAAFVIVAFLVTWSNTNTVHERALEKQLYSYNDRLTILGKDLSGIIELEEGIGTDGRTIYTVTLNTGSEKIVKEMAEAYNTIPNMEPVTVENVKSCLTEGMLEPTSQWANGSPFRKFITWCNAYASTPPDPVEGSGAPIPAYPDTPLPNWELVNKEDLYDDAGNVIVAAGALVIREIDPARIKPISNYEYFIGKGEYGSCSNYEYAWQYNEEHPDNPVVTQ